MLIALIGESCVGKSTLAEYLHQQLDAEVYSGKDYLRLAKNEALAQKQFSEKLKTAVSGKNLICVISEKDHLAFLPEGTVKILMTADLSLILGRFAARMHGNLPLPVRQMLERKHGCFDRESCHFHIHNNEGMEAVAEAIVCKQ